MPLVLINASQWLLATIPLRQTVAAGPLKHGLFLQAVTLVLADTAELNAEVGLLSWLKEAFGDLPPYEQLGYAVGG